MSVSASSIKRDWIDGILSDEPLSAVVVEPVAAAMEDSQPLHSTTESPFSHLHRAPVSGGGGRISSPARYRRPSASGGASDAVGASYSVVSSIRSGTNLALHPTDDDDDSNDDESALQYSRRERYVVNSSNRSYNSNDRNMDGCLSGMTDRLWCETLQPCLGGSSTTQVRQQQQRTGRMELEHQQLQLKMQQMRLLNGKLFARNQVLEQENTAALATAQQTTTTSDGTVTALQQRCHEAERKNIQLQTELVTLQGEVQVFEVTSTSLQKQLDELHPHQDSNDARTDKSTIAGTLAEHGPGNMETLSTFATAELERLTMALEESEKKQTFSHCEQLQQQQEHVVSTEKLQANLERAQEQFLEREITLKAQIETLQALAVVSTRTNTSTSHNAVVDDDTTDLLNDRDDTIATLRQQCLDYSQQLTILQTQAVRTATASVSAPQADIVQQLESELQHAKKNAEHQEATLTDSIRELETKYGSMERQLLEAKLAVAASDEAKEHLMEEYQAKLDAIEAEKTRIVIEHESVQQDKNRLIGDLTAQLESTIKESEALAPLQSEKDNIISQMTLALEAMKASKDQLVSDFEFERCKQKSSEEESKRNDTTKLAALSTEVQDLKHRLDQENNVQRPDQSLSLVELRQTVQRAKQTEDALRRQLTMALEDTGAADNIKKLEQQLDERNATIAHLSEQVTELTREKEDHIPVSISRGELEETAESNPVEISATKDEWSMQRIDELSSKVKKLKKQLTISKNENSRLRVQAVMKSKGQDLKLDGTSIDTDDTADDDSSTTTASSRRLLKERDDAIASLVKQVMTQDVLVTELRNEVTTLRSEKLDRKTLESSSQSSVQQLQKEADVFAGQVIELDGEIEQLKSALAQQERKVVELEAQVEESRRRPKAQSNILELEAEIDELKEANTTQRSELRDWRRRAWETDSSSDEIVRLRNEALVAAQAAERKKIALGQLDEERSKLRVELELERTNKAALETQLLGQLAKLEKSCEERTVILKEKLDESRWAFDELKASPGHMSEDAVIALRDEITNLRHDLGNQTEEVDRAKRNVQELEEMLAEKSSVEIGAFEEEKEYFLSEIESLTRQLEDARERIRVLETDVVIIDEFKSKLERADEAREESENNIIDSYERKVALLTLDKDVTIDKLRKELTIEKESNAEELQEVTDQLKLYQIEVSDLREEMTDQVAHRESRIFDLEQILAAQEQLVSNMKIEMDHLQGSMEGSAARRKEENDEMQQELLSLTATTAKQEREIQSLQMELETKTLGHQSEVAKLENKITALEKNPQELRNAHDLQMELRVKEVKDRLEKLKWRNTSIKEENLNLRERLEQAEAIAKDSADHDRIKALENLLSKQMAKVKTLESQLKSSKEPPVPDKTTISNSREPPAGSSAMLELPVIESPITQSNTVVVSIDKKISTPSPSRTGMLKIFNRKNAMNSQGKSDAS